MDQLGKGRAEAIRDSDMAKLADEIGCHPADLEAIAEVESNGFGWFPDGRMKILFEKHQFYKRIPDATQRANAVKSGLARKNFISPSKGGYKDQGSATDRYKLLERAIKINEEGAYQSISMGSYQIMGFNAGTCGFVSAKQMFVQFCDSEVNQLRAFARFLKSNNLCPALRARNFAQIETVYNGGGLNGVYAKRMMAASQKLRAGKWKNYKAGSVAAPAPTPAPAKPIIPPPVPKPAPVPEISKPPVQPVPGGPRARFWAALFTAIASMFRKAKP
jgi:hypothetical protein